MKIVIESHIPFIKGIFDAVADVLYLPAEAITPAVMKDADALITRTRTRCDESLLRGSRCSFIATATIGTDHIDLDYCRERDIKVVSAPGCNAPAVAQYVLCSVLSVLGDVKGKTIGVVGVGHVGSIVCRWSECLGMTVLRNDPPRAEAEGSDGFVSLAEIAQNAEVITFHTPHTRTGKFATHHLADKVFFNSLVRKPVVINSARGPIFDTPSLLGAMDSGSVSAAVIDCWEGEPAISPELLEKAVIATPHIAGYSLEGKVRATIAVVEALSQHFSLGIDFPGEKPAVPPLTVAPSALLSSYNPLSDTAMLKADPSAFESLRNNYNFRHEPRA
ncbi:MAG: 4-phosphoerythronate dehydrogenase [Muribaculaceae bacterium]